ncbi:hypothetical protein C9I28_11460 [Pseudoduganella armeniaca]|uniref:Uncharacterized protein n=1 Tax=Pseudoduganella armeniaca TaxID=2072590 RepID=A0A2R4C9C6_9BURK|nr:hypothetical protein C9I28_11460 [Pseudoduganella armeniaca]
MRRYADACIDFRSVIMRQPIRQLIFRCLAVAAFCLAAPGCSSWAEATKCLPTTPGFPLCGL